MEFNKLDSTDKTAKGLYSLIRRDDQGKLIVVPYHTAFAAQVKKASDLLMEASKYADDPGLKKYLELRSKAFLDDDYYKSDLAWMDMKNNVIDFVVGPIESYEDQLNGYKASHEAYILVKDIEWSKKLNHYSALLPKLQKDYRLMRNTRRKCPAAIPTWELMM